MAGLGPATHDLKAAKVSARSFRCHRIVRYFRLLTGSEPVQTNRLFIVCRRQVVGGRAKPGHGNGEHWSAAMESLGPLTMESIGPLTTESVGPRQWRALVHMGA
jgi:hypothetical protein